MVWCVWLTRDFDAAYVRQAVLESQADAILLEGEVPATQPNAVNWPSVIAALEDIDIPKGIVTNFAPFTDNLGNVLPWLAQPLIQDGWACVTECFLTESPNAFPATLDWFGKSILGWPRTQPMIEAWDMGRYGDMSGYSGVSHWDAGNVL
jgi:hypothetical protein